MLTQAQLDLRKTGITATDSTIICGLSPWGSKLDVWLEKKDMLAPLDETAEHLILGHMMEPIIAERFCAKTGHIIFDHDPPTCIHKTIPWCLATPDRILLDAPDESPALLECKLVGSFKVRDWDPTSPDGVPAYVYGQVQWQMFVTGFKTCYVAALLGGTQHEFWEISRDENVISKMFERCKDFWENHVLADVPPEFNTRYATLVASDYEGDKMLLPNDDIMEAARAYRDCHCRIQELERMKDEAKAELISIIGPDEGVTGICTFRPDKNGKRIFRFNYEFKEEDNE